MHAVEFLKQEAPAVSAVVVLLGGQRHLKHAALSRLRSLVIDDDDTALTRFVGKETDLQTVADELRTVSMWGDRRLVVIDDADDFVSKHRAGLEKYAESPAKKSVLVLDVGSWPKTTRLAKQLAKTGLEVECTELKGALLSKWLVDTARDSYQVTLPRDAAALLIELVGEELGLLDQELAKLSSYVGVRKQIAVDDVRGLVGGWRTETTWAMTDAVRDGRLPDALDALGQLLQAGEAGPKLLGGINFVYRKLALATELARHKNLETALKEAAVFPRDAGPAAAYLRRIGRARAEQILTALVTADAGLKGMSRLPERLQLELLLLRLSGDAAR
jgi:DNA polymerase-3 subunit delta